MQKNWVLAERNTDIDRYHVSVSEDARDWQKIQPDMIYNRFDLICKESTELLYVVCEGEEGFYVPCHLVDDTAVLGVWGMQLTMAQAQAVAAYIFEHHPNVLVVNNERTNFIDAPETFQKVNDFHIPLPESADELDERLSPRTRSMHRRKWRLARKAYASIAVEEYGVDAPQAKKLFDVYFAMKRITHGREYHMTMDEYVQTYHVTTIYALRFDDHVAAIVLLCEQGSSVYLENLTYDLAFAKFSPGQMLYNESMKRLIGKKKMNLYVAGGNLDYKYHYGSVEQWLSSFLIYRNANVAEDKLLAGLMPTRKTRGAVIQPLRIQTEIRILIVAPHPDDECIGAGGVLVKYGGQCDVVLLTDGSACHTDRPYSQAEIVALRQEEFAREMAMAGVHRYVSLGIEDGTLALHPDCLMGIDFSAYDAVFVTGSTDTHPDHRAAFTCVRRALEKQKVSPAVYEYEITEPSAWATHYLDITDVIEQKLDLIRQHQSQVCVFDYVALTRSINAYRGVRIQNAVYAEAYQQVSLEASEVCTEIENFTARLQRCEQRHQVACRWLQWNARHKTIEELLLKKGWHRIAVYGYTFFTRILLETLAGGNVSIAYVIDRKGERLNVSGCKVLRPSDALDQVDVVIVTVLQEAKEIETMLSQKHLHAISLADLLAEED